jgi:hypothetical protein
VARDIVKRSMVTFIPLIFPDMNLNLRLASKLQSGKRNRLVAWV